MSVSSGGVSVTNNAPYVLKQSGVPLTLTGTTTETTMETVVIPGGVVGPNGSVRITSYWSCTNNANNKTLRIRLGSIAGTSYMAPVISSNAVVHQVTIIRAANSQSSQKGYNPGSFGGLGANSGNGVTSSVDMTVNQNLLFTGTLAVGTDSLVLESYTIEILPS